MTTEEVESLLGLCRGVTPHPCQGCKGFNNAVKCAGVKPAECVKLLVNGK